MCGRFALTVDIEKIANTFGVEPTLNTVRRYNIAPTQNVVSIMRNGEAHLAELGWGLIDSWAKDESIGSRMINDRVESLTEKPSFKGLLRSKRCLIIADGFYEWRQDNGYKTPMYISMKDSEPFAFAGLWDNWKSHDGQQLRTCTIITTEPNEVVASIHNRMPAILLPEARAAWLHPASKDEHLLEHWLPPYPSGGMTARAGSRPVNDPKHNSPDVLA